MKDYADLEKYENKSICAKCGGYCCKKCGCDYFVSDFDSMKIDYLSSVLDSGYASIIATLDFSRNKYGNLTLNPILSFRARNVNRGAIDLLSMKTRCLSLGDNGCSFSLTERPSGGVRLIPMEHRRCYSDIDRIDELKKWSPYQQVLQRLVKRYTGMSVHAKLKEDVYNLFIAMENGDFREIAIEEIKDLKGMLPLLIEFYPEEYQKAKAKSYSKVLRPENKDTQH